MYKHKCHRHHHNQDQEEDTRKAPELSRHPPGVRPSWAPGSWAPGKQRVGGAWQAGGSPQLLGWGSEGLAIVNRFLLM